MTRRCAPRSGAEPNDSRRGWIDRNEKTRCCSTATDVNVWQSSSSGQDVCRRVGDVSLMNESGIGGGCPLFFRVKSRTTQITPRWGYLSIPWHSWRIRLTLSLDCQVPSKMQLAWQKEVPFALLGWLNFRLSSIWHFREQLNVKIYSNYPALPYSQLW